MPENSDWYVWEQEKVWFVSAEAIYHVLSFHLCTKWVLTQDKGNTIKLCLTLLWHTERSAHGTLEANHCQLLDCLVFFAATDPTCTDEQLTHMAPYTVALSQTVVPFEKDPDLRSWRNKAMWCAWRVFDSRGRSFPFVSARWCCLAVWPPFQLSSNCIRPV